MRPARAIRRPINVVTGEQSSPTAEVLLRLRRESNEVAVLSTLSRVSVALVEIVHLLHGSLKYAEGARLSSRIFANEEPVETLMLVV